MGKKQYGAPKVHTYTIRYTYNTSKSVREWTTHITAANASKALTQFYARFTGTSLASIKRDDG